MAQRARLLNDWEASKGVTNCQRRRFNFKVCQSVFSLFRFFFPFYLPLVIRVRLETFFELSLSISSFFYCFCFCCIFFFHTWHLQRGVKSQPTSWHYRAGFTYKIKYWIGFFGLWLPDFRFVSSATSAWWNLRQLKNQFRFSFKCDKLFQQNSCEIPSIDSSERPQKI